MCNYVLMHADIYVHAVIANWKQILLTKYFIWYFTFYIYLLIHLDLCVHVDGYDTNAF